MKETVEKQSLSFGIELGSTRIKAVAIDEDFRAVSSGDYTWVSRCENGIWTYPLEQVWEGLRAALSGIADRERISALGISGMMHGYLAFDKDWSLLVPFRTWQNTMTAQAAAELTEVFGFNIPQRWSIAHLYQAVLNGEAHIEKIAHITTLAGFVHYKLTGVNAVGIGEDSGIFPIDSTGKCYDKTMLHKFSILPENRDLPWRVEDVLPRVLVAGESAGQLTAEGAALLGGLLPAGIPLAPPEGDAGTGVAATNAVAPASGNVSAGTSIFAMVVLDKPLSGVYPEIDMVTTPTGEPVAMVHCNNCTNDMNAWAELLRQNLALFGCTIDRESLFTKLYVESLNGDPDCGGITVCNYLAGEPVTGFGRGCPLVMRTQQSIFTPANFMRAQLYSAIATLALGMDILKKENVRISRLTGHGGLFKTPVVGQRFLAAAVNSPVCVMKTAGEGGPYGMALLSAYLTAGRGRTLEMFLEQDVFENAKSVVMEPLQEDVAGFEAYLRQFRNGLAVERAAVECI